MGQELAIVARWCLWLGAIASIATVIAGFFAYYTVAHDTASHLAMTVHRNWAIATVLAILLASAWSGWRHLKKQPIGVAFLGLMLVAMLLVLTTAWYGAEVVFRYGIGVQSLPSSAEKGHEHHTH